MKFGKLTLILSAILSVSALVEATVQLKLNKSIADGSTMINFAKNEGFCGPNNICLENEINLGPKGDHFNFDGKKKLWKPFKEVKYITYKAFDPKKQPTNQVIENYYLYKIIMISKFDRDTAPNAEMEFYGAIFDSKVSINNPRLDFIVLERFPAEERWRYKALTHKSIDENGSNTVSLQGIYYPDDYALRAAKALDIKNFEKYKHLIPQEAKDLVEGKK